MVTSLDEGRGAFAGFIGPRTLLGIVENTAPYLFARDELVFPSLRYGPVEARLPPLAGSTLEVARHPLGWWALLRRARQPAATSAPTPEQWVEYFALCIAAHMATIGTLVSADVDTKIRSHLWFIGLPSAALAVMKELALVTRSWDLRAVSNGYVLDPQIGATSPDGGGTRTLSGHDGERLAVMTGGMIGLLAAGDARGAEELEAAVTYELEREADAIAQLAARPGRERDLLTAAALVTHSAGDVDQGLSAPEGQRFGEAQRARFAELGHGGFARFGGAFATAARLYKELLSAEGHRHYPLREVRPLRADPSLTLPVGPFLDDWGERLARHRAFGGAERAEVIEGVVIAATKVKKQLGYYRALAGIDAGLPGGLWSRDLEASIGSRARRELRAPELRKLVSVKQASFEHGYAKRARALLTAGRAS